MRIKFNLKVIEMEKKLFSILLERGTEVKIPASLDQNFLPASFKYYDSIIGIVKLNFTAQSKDFSKLKKSISYAFDQRFHANSFFFKKSGEAGGGKLKATHSIRKKDNKFDFINSFHTMQV